MLLPDDFIDRMTGQLGNDSSAFFDALQRDSPVSIRLNPFKPFDETARFDKAEVIPWCQSGRYLPVRPSFTLDPYFHAGCYYVQEASSMYIGRVVEEFLATRSVSMALDLCAAPGGKSTHLRSILPDDCLLVSNEVIPSRNQVLCQNLAKWGHPATVVIRNEPEEIGVSGVLFDLIVVDAPCSGEGMFRKDPAAVSEWSLSSVTACSLRQRRILEAALQALAPGGLLIYSTCTWSPEEDQGITKWLSAEHGLMAVPLPAFPGIRMEEGGAFFYPHLVRGEGFFVNAFIKPESAVADNKLTGFIKRKRAPVVKDASLEAFKKQYFPDPALICFRAGEQGWVLPEVHFEKWEQLHSRMRIFSSGTRAAEKKGDNWIPAPEAALSVSLVETCSRTEVDEERALRYLRGESIPIERAAGGWQLVTFNGFGLGWGKAVQGRLNNGYPKEWRIRMDITT
jgi:16S rRNA C967 or C1407 C5-methylase (RsmB/RsmF family)/NOL1/NOP2/fmu family ribosome biogenesis protein